MNNIKLTNEKKNNFSLANLEDPIVPATDEESGVFAVMIVGAVVIVVVA